MASAMGDPDAVAVGDFHLKNLVSTALAGEPRGTDQRMLELLAPYAGQRGQGDSAVVPRRPPAAHVRAAPAHLADGTVVNECLC